MNILVTNDDGLQSEGIQVLAATLRTKHNVWVIAPHCDRSGVSHGITLKDPLRFSNEGERVFSCNGLPADCALSGQHVIMPVVPNLVVSGINRGANIGTDIVYSGTAAAARQAVFNGIPGIAVSLMSLDDVWYWKSMSQFVLNNLSLLMDLCDDNIFVNINALSQKTWKGARLTTISRRFYKDNISVLNGPDGHKYGFFYGGNIESHGDEHTDWVAVKEGWISISRVYAQPIPAKVEDKKNINFIL